mmetsp:Transcript_52510/g.139588  ORF Transcript_52510/g.139588 Transcript_52510/m.139588 type:complete len:585 (-) Transcript_52510:473-2227(-)
MAEQITDIDTAMGQIGGLRRQDWAGGSVPTPLHAGGGAATLADAHVVSIPVEHFVVGGGSVAIKVAKLSLLNIAGANVRCSTAASFLIALTSANEVTDALAATLATNQAGLAAFSAANAGAAASPQVTAMVQARGGPPPGPRRPARRRPSGAAAGDKGAAGGDGGRRDDAEGGRRRRGRGGHHLEAHPPEIAAVSPREAEILALRAALAAATGAAAPAPVPAPAPSPAGGLPPALPAPLPAPPAPAAGPLVGMEVLRPPPPPGGAAATDADIFAAAGGQPIFETLAKTAGRAYAIIIMSGPGADGTVEDAAADFEQLLAECLQGAPGDVRFCPSAPPPGPRGSGVAHPLGAAADQPPALRGGCCPWRRRRLKPRPEVRRLEGAEAYAQRPEEPGARAARVLRCARLLNPLCERPSLLVSAQAGRVDDQLLEARRMIDLLGNPAAGYTLSNGEITEELKGEFPCSLVASRTGFCSWLKTQVEEPAGPKRVRDAAADTLLLIGSIAAVDLRFTPIVVRWGGFEPEAGQWTVAGPTPDVAARWGTVEGEYAFGDCERAMTAFGPLLARVLVDVGGAQTPISTRAWAS